ncbi:hypothetical protein DYB32_009905, partial [Aphanomyces invadans]
KTMDKEVVRRTEEPVLEHFVPDSIAPFFGLLIGLGVRLSTVLDWKDLERYRLNSSNLHLIQRLVRLSCSVFACWNASDKNAQASGGFGSVWLGKYDQNDVAVKLLASGRIKTQDSMQRFINEVKLLARLQHPNVVEFIGACWQSLDTVHLVVEYMNMGDLKDHLDRHATMPWQHKLQCAVDVAEGLSYLHHLEIIHRDLKSRNVLMDSHKPCKLSDFGISRKVVSTTMSQEVGTFLWAAPEALNGSQLTVAADIYSFGTSIVVAHLVDGCCGCDGLFMLGYVGMILSELDTHRVPFDGLATEYGDVLVPMAIVMKVMEGELQVQPSPGCPLPIALIMKACTQHDPKLRPTANELLDTLRTLRL